MKNTNLIKGLKMNIKNANSHPIQVEIVGADENNFYANSHPYKVAVVGGHIGIEGRVVDELPQEGETGYIYLVLKETTSEGDIYDEYMWTLQQDGETYAWEHIGATNEVTLEIDDQMSDTSENAVQNKVIKDYVDTGLSGKQGTLTAGDGIDITNDVIKATNTGKARVLTTDDYNYNSSTGTATDPNCVALWLLEPGMYTTESSSVLLVRNSSEMPYHFMGVFTVGEPESGYKTIVELGNNLDGGIQVFAVGATSGSPRYEYTVAAREYVDNRVKRNAGAPTTATVGQVGTLYEDTTNGDLYICTDATNPYVWEEVGAGSGVTELTSADYNYPTSNPTSVALWLLENGTYYAADSSVVVVASINAVDSVSQGVYIVADYGVGSKQIEVFSQGTGYYGSYRVNKTTGARVSFASFQAPTVVQTTGTNTENVMSQNAVTSMVFADPSAKQKVQIGVGAGAGGTSSVAIGYESGANGTTSTGVGSRANAYGSSSVAVGYGALGYGSSSTAIGSEAQVQLGVDSGTALGRSATVNNKGAIALGAYSLTDAVGQMNIGSTNTSYGYNNSNYRLLTGLYDGQSAHDAATYGQLSTAIINGGTTAPTTATVGAVGTLYSYVDTTGTPTPHMMVCTVADTVTPSYTWVEVGGGGSVATINSTDWNNLWQ